MRALTLSTDVNHEPHVLPITELGEQVEEELVEVVATSEIVLVVDQGYLP